MIIRVFKASIYPEVKEEFALKFRDVSVPIVQRADGLISLEIGGPMDEESNEFLMISKWDNKESIEAFAGEDWNKAFIPDGMEDYIKECSIIHFQNIDLEEN